MRIHSGERPFKCDHKNCDTQFKTSGHLKEHKKIHFDTRPYQCSKCNGRFSRISTLKTHMQSTTHRDSQTKTFETLDDSIQNDIFNLKFKDESFKINSNSFSFVMGICETKKEETRYSEDSNYKECYSDLNDLLNAFHVNYEENTISSFRV